MAEIVNLNKRRKQRERAEQEACAATNRARHGRTRAERARDSQDAERRERATAGAKLDPSPESAFENSDGAAKKARALPLDPVRLIRSHEQQHALQVCQLPIKAPDRTLRTPIRGRLA